MDPIFWAIAAVCFLSAFFLISSISFCEKTQAPPRELPKAKLHANLKFARNYPIDIGRFEVWCPGEGIPSLGGQTIDLEITKVGDAWHVPLPRSSDLASVWGGRYDVNDVYETLVTLTNYLEKKITFSGNQGDTDIAGVENLPHVEV